MKTFKTVLYQSLFFLVFLYFLFLLLRLIFVVYLGFYQGNLSLYNFNDLATFFINAFRYDGQIIGACAAVFFFLLLILNDKIAKIYAFLLIFITVFVEFANIAFYEIYQDVFNATLLGLIFDDKQAMFETALNGGFNFTYKVIIWLLLSTVFYFVFSKIFSLISKVKNYESKKTAKNSIVFAVFFLACLFAINGQIGLKGISLGKELIPVENDFLRKCTFGSFRDLTYVIKSYKKIFNSDFSDYTDKTVLESVNFFFDTNYSKQSGINLATLLSKEVENPEFKEIKHIFYIIAESYSAWHFNDEFKELGLSDNMKKFIQEYKAYKSDILHNATGTIRSLDVQISGLFNFEIPLSLSVGKSPVFKSAPAYILKDLGYKSNFYYGGSGTWQKIDVYTASQGFEKIFYNTHIIDFAKKNKLKEPYFNAWGAYDEYLYKFLLANTKEDEKSFNMILTTSYHPPYDVPLQDFNISFEKIDEFISKNSHKISDKTMLRKILSHIIYQDIQISSFIKEASAKFPNSLFVVTGDHYDMKYPFANPKFKDSNSIPLIIYSPALDIKSLSKTGSHIDILPSIVNLVAPNKYKYVSFGSPLVSTKQTKMLSKEALGYLAVANDDFIYYADKLQYFDEKNQGKEDDISLAKELFERLKIAKALSYLIFKEGYELK